MTLDEAIKHAEEVAEEKENEGRLLYQSEGASIGCLTCAEEHRQLAEWLKELKQLREEQAREKILDFIEDNYPTEIGTDWERGCAYVLDEIEKICKEESEENKNV